MSGESLNFKDRSSCIYMRSCGSDLLDFIIKAQFLINNEQFFNFKFFNVKAFDVNNNKLPITLTNKASNTLKNFIKLKKKVSIKLKTLMTHILIK